MDSSVNHSNNRSKWRKRSSIHQNYKTPLIFFLLASIIIVLFISSKTFISSTLLSISQPILRPQCEGSGEKFLWYAPHSGFSNQLSEFKNAIVMAAILNRTLVLPPILDHHAVALGSCPKFRVLEPNDLRFKVWNHSVNLIRECRYASMDDIIDLSSLVSISAIRFIDFRVFVSQWCGVTVNSVSVEDSNPSSSFLEKLKQCGSLLSGYENNVDTCLYASQEDCRTTVWTYQNNDKDGALDSFQADHELRNKRKISYLRTRKDVYKTFGPESTAGAATVLAFGSLFTGAYKGSESHIDIHEAPRDQGVHSLIKKIEFLPFVPEIINAGKKFARETINAPFLCVQLRLLDGQFKNHWKSTFLGMKQKLDLLKQRDSLPIHIFVMTDLPRENWTGSYLGDLEKDSNSFKLFVLRDEDELVSQTSNRIVNAGHGMKSQFASENLDRKEKQCVGQSLPDILLYVEETICSCASLGFVGTAGSTIAESIELMRKNKICLR